MTWVDDIRQMKPSTGVDGLGTLAGDEGGGASVTAPPAPPPPPAPRPAKRRPTAGMLARIPFRYQLAAGGVAIVAATVIFTRMFVHPVDEQAITRAATAAALAETQQQLSTARAEATQIAVPSPFSWAKCPLSNEAAGLIGGDPATGGRTLNPQRAAPLEQQAQSLLTAFTLQQLRIVSPTLGGLQIVADDPTAGVAVFACAAGNETPAPPSTVAVAAG